MSDIRSSQFFMSLLTVMKPERTGTQGGVSVGFSKKVDLKKEGAWESYALVITATALTDPTVRIALETAEASSVGDVTVQGADNKTWEGLTSFNPGKVMAIYLEAPAENTGVISYLSDTDPAVEQIPSGQLSAGAVMGAMVGAYAELPVPIYLFQFTAIGDKLKMNVVLMPNA